MTTTFLSDADLTRLKTQYPGLDRCPTCRDKGHFTWDGEERTCDCDRQRRLHVQYLHAGIGVTYQRLMWSDFTGPGALLDPFLDYIDNAEAYIDRGIGLFISGPVGTGKTMLANLVLKELVKRGYKCNATTFSSTVEAFTAGWNSQEEKQRFAERFMYSEVLLLDDMGKEFRRQNGLHQTTFDHILRTRVQAGRPTLLTTNMTPQEVKTGYGAAVLSLLVEQSIEILLPGEDFRPTAHDRTVAEVRSKEVRPIV